MRLEEKGIPCQLLDSHATKMAYDSEADTLALMTIHSSKGLEFERVIMIGVGQMDDDEARRQQSARLLYVGMTRARKYLLMTISGNNEFSQRIMAEQERLQGQFRENGAAHESGVSNPEPA